MNINNIKLKVISAVLFLMSTVNVFAQPTPPSQSPPYPSGDDDDAVASIDQALIWLLIAGVFAALYFLQTKRIAKTEK